MSRQDPGGSIGWPFDYGSGDAEGPKFIQCVDRQEPQTHKFWDFDENGVTCESHPTAQVDVGAGVVNSL